MTRKRYTKEFKEEMVKMVIEQRVAAAQAAKDHGICYSTMEKWVRDHRNQKKDSNTLLENERDELIRLRKENYRLKMERDILKKTALLFAKETDGDSK